ncbi:phosphate signaling complex protein PhoU [Planctomyces sp. SH-PL62]|uniref:phosphate signaling complex protein PhoU n=1 Tax=Planctomyces sp. SH-PL62 TaxID=1636152 RepID=UPI00078ED94E|nr:phosphate signaling complex protein PhoU [Planctomyces sp. SH-PL62]AMV36389.1 hypothetical protein VT85_03060 [Planctomyces sp. SH-PL62]
MASSRSQEGRAATGGVPRHAFREQDAVWAELLALGQTVIGSLDKSVQAVCDGRIDLVSEVKEEEEETDRKEVRIEQECLRVLALFEPVASDLRRMATILKVNRDWERIADLALRVARRVRKLGRKFPELAPPDSLKDLARDVLVHVKASYVALVEIDSTKAREVIIGDQVIDESYRAVRRQLKDQLAARADQLDGWLLLLNSARNLERIADHATGIAQTVVFLQEGTIIRHSDPA